MNNIEYANMYVFLFWITEVYIPNLPIPFDTKAIE